MADSTPDLILATRLHLGRAAAPPSKEKLSQLITTLSSNAAAAASSGRTVRAVIAVDATPNLDLVRAVEEAIVVEKEEITILPVSPWGKFVPALNALVTYAAGAGAVQLLLLSAEVSASAGTIDALCRHAAAEGTLVAGVALPGHDYHHGKLKTPLTGRTCPWNTLAVWNVGKLSMTGFSTVSDLGATAGVEECVAIAISQKIFSPSESKAKLVKLDDVQWEVDFGDDAERKAWHESKMESKLSRAQAQMDQLGLSGEVIHC